MLYVFCMNRGVMLTLDISFAVQPVQQLQLAIETQTGIPVTSQVLLISGGECLNPLNRVTDYSSHGAGTDTNPIFLVYHNEAGFVPEGFSNQPLRELEGCLAEARRLNPGFQSLKQMTQYALTIAQYTDQDAELCARLVSEQHLLQQGWFIVIANLDDSIKTFSKRLERFRLRYQRYLESREMYKEMLHQFPSDMEILRDIPLLSCLQAKRPQIDGISFQQSLFDWISSADPQHSLTDLAEQVDRYLTEFDSNVVENLERQFADAFSAALDEQMKEIKGLGKRLAKLDEYLQDKILKNQREQRAFCTSFDRKQEQRALSERDESILVTLHQSQTQILNQMYGVYKTSWDLIERFHRSKQELLQNIDRRLQWVSGIESTLIELDTQLVMRGEHLKRLRDQVDVLRQIHEAPFVYAAALSEIVRRRAFSAQYLTWAEQLVGKVQVIYKTEIMTRGDVTQRLHTHFLRALFPGMDDVVPDFATVTPAPFDTALPPLTEQDLATFRTAVTNLPVAVLTLVQSPLVNVYAELSTPTSADALVPVPSFHHNATAPANLSEGPRSTVWPSGAGISSNESLSDKLGDLPSVTTRNGGKSTSLPIRIPSRASSETGGIGPFSRQMSEKSNSFGTPEAEYGLDKGPPESPNQDILRGDQGGLLFDQSSSGEESQQHTQLEFYRSRIVLLEGQVKRGVLLASSRLLPMLLDMRTQLKDLSDELGSQKKLQAQFSANALQQSAMYVERFVLNEQKRFQDAQAIVLRQQADSYCDNIRALENQLEIERNKYRDAENELEIYRTTIRQRDEQLEAMQQEAVNQEERHASAMAARERLLEERMQLEKNEIVKQMMIDQELELEEMRESTKAQVDSRDSRIDDLIGEINDKNMLIRHLREEQNKLAQSICDQDSSVVADMEAVQRIEREWEHRLQAHNEEWQNRLKRECEDHSRQFQTKAQLLTAGLEEQNQQSLERLRVEKELEIRALIDKHEMKLADLKAAHAAEVKRLQEAPTPQSPQLNQLSHSTVVPSGSGYSLSGGSLALGERTHHHKEKSSLMLQSSSSSNSKALVGEYVLFVYDATCQNYRMYAPFNVPHFLSHKSLEAFGVQKGTAPDCFQKEFLRGVVTKQDYCITKKEKNSFHISKGTKFYLIEAQPYFEQQGQVAEKSDESKEVEE